MPLPRLLLNRSTELRRNATPADFTVDERREMIRVLTYCLHEGARALAMATALNEVTLGSQPAIRAQVIGMADHVTSLQDLYEAFSIAQRLSDGFEASGPQPLLPQ